jgi:hypothetical protein
MHLSSYPICIQEINHLTVEYPHGTVEEDVQSGPNEKVNQEHHDFIECWFQTTISSNHHFLLQPFLTSYHLKQLVSHALVYIKAYFSNMTMNMFVILLHTWIH